LTLASQVEDIKQAIKKYRQNPGRTSKLGLRKAAYKGWLVLEQNPKRDSPYARLHRAGIDVAHLIHQEDDLFAGFLIRDNIYLKPAVLEQHFDPQILNETLTRYFEDMQTDTVAGVRLQYHPDEKGKSMVIRLEDRNIHMGIRLDLIERVLL